MPEINTKDATEIIVRATTALEDVTRDVMEQCKQRDEELFGDFEGMLTRKFELYANKELWLTFLAAIKVQDPDELEKIAAQLIEIAEEQRWGEINTDRVFARALLIKAKSCISEYDESSRPRELIDEVLQELITH